MDGESPSQETSQSKTPCHTDTNNNNQTDEPGLEDSKGPGEDPPAGETAEGRGEVEVGRKGEEDSQPEQGGEQDASGRHTDKPNSTATKHVEDDPEDARHNKDKASTNVDNTEVSHEQKNEEGEREENKLEEVKNCEAGRVGEEIKDKNTEKEMSKMEDEAKEAEKDGIEKNIKGAELKRQVKEVDVEAKNRQKIMEKQGKPKRKSGPPSSSLSRPRPSARSLRASAKNDIIAKFQQGAPETPLPRNFKIQRSSTALATGASIKQKILQWCQNKTRKYEGVNIENFSSSWCNGLAFCALVHRYFPDAFDFSSLNPKEREKNFTLAFQTAESLADCYPLLEVGDMLMMGNNPDPMCVFTYVQSLCHNLSKIEKERKDKEKEEKDKAGEEGEKGGDGAGEVSLEKDEAKSAEIGITKSQEEKQGDVMEIKETGEEENAPHICEMEGHAGETAEAETSKNTDNKEQEC